jgi:glycosyltransferase involved in cell wall biosynthesis
LLKNFPKISIVTISYNQGQYLEQTILSVLSQNYPNLEYIIIDGGSTDNSVEIIKKYADKLTYWTTEPDKGQYDAVEKGLNRCTGEIMAWINSDDFYLPGAFMKVADIFQERVEINWLRSLPLECDEKGSIYNRIAIPWARWSKYRYLTNDFQFIQQESCFWRKKVWDNAGRAMDKKIKYAGDMELWARFFRKEKLYTINDHFAVFRQRETNQISKIFLKEYLQEGVGIVRREKSRLSFFQRAIVFYLFFIRIFYGPFFFFNIPILKYIYEWSFKIPKLVPGRSDQPGSTKQIKLPPIILGNYVFQKRSFSLK